MYRFKVILICAFTCYVTCCGAQTFFRFTDGATKHKIHFELYRNIIVIPLYINGSGPYNFILDTGAGNCLITDPKLVDALQLHKGREIIINGSGADKAVDAFLVHDIKITGRNMESLPLTMAAFKQDAFFLSEYLGCEIHGILGFEFFNSFAVQINYQNHVLSLYDPLKFTAGKQYTGIPLSVKNKRPFLQGFFVTPHDSVVSLKDILIDTGAGFPVSMETYSDSSISPAEKYLEAELGIGLNGVITGRIARAKQFGFDQFIFSNIVTAYPDYASTGIKQVNEQRNGSIGNFLLNRFTVIFNYAQQTMYVKPNAKLKDTFPYDRTGLEVIATGDDFVQFIVKAVKPNSPAMELGILPGDEIQEINFKKITTYELSEIDHIFSDEKSNTITLRIKRGYETFFMILEMRDLI